MNRSNPDQVSVLVDGEHQDWELTHIVQSLEHDTEAQARWCNYHVISDAMRGRLPTHLCIGLAERVTRAIESEPAYLNPRTAVPHPAQINRTRTAVGFALAASLSAIAVVGVLQIGGGGIDGGDMAVMASAERAPAPVAPQSAPAETAPVVARAEEPERAAPVYTFTADVSAMPTFAASRSAAPEPARVHTVAVSRGSPLGSDFTDYLMNYQRLAAGGPDREDAFSYLRLVGHGTD